MSRLASLFMNEENRPSGDEIRRREETEKSPYRILFVDDEKNVLRAMQRIFRQETYRILTAESGEEALSLLEKTPAQVVISDFRMPGMNGTDLLREIKARYPRTIRIMLTGNADVHAVMGAINDGAVYKFITKPWNDEDLRLTVSLALEQYDLLQENRSLKKQQSTQDRRIRQLGRFVHVNRSQLGRMLARKRVIRKTDLDKALAAQTKTKQTLSEILLELDLVDEKAIMRTIREEMKIDRVDPAEFSTPRVLADLIPREICRKNLLVPLKRDQGNLIVAMADPTDYLMADDLRFITGIPVQPVLATQAAIRAKIEDLYGPDDGPDTPLTELEQLDPTETIEIILEEDDEEADLETLLQAKDLPPAIRIVNAVISDALRHHASDVHIEPKNKYIVVRYRIDGLLQEKLHIPLAMLPSIVSRIKVMSDLDIAERRKPQDGRITVKTSTRMVDMRISTLPTINGEKTVLRVLDKNASIKDVEELGLNPRDLGIVLRFLEQPQGILLTTGPTGSGKTSSLYSLLQKGATVTKNYTTIEDPVEYYMGMAEQVTVREKIGLRFPMVLRAILRQDPNVIMLGEIRDFETAEVAFHAALTGHLVLSTLHTNGSVASITRLRDMGLKPYVISDALIGIVAQRLVRRICPYCAEEDRPSAEVLRGLRLQTDRMDFVPRKGRGCDRCNQTGYSGRIGIFEVFPVDGELKKMIHQDATETELVRAARWTGMTTLLDDARDKIQQGLTTCEEVLRVLGPQDGIHIRCPACSGTMDERYPFCPLCGHAMFPRCRSCRKTLHADWVVCPFCGERQ